MSVYRNPTFKVEVDGQESSGYRQDTGIRQGRPLSPYMFLVVTTAIFRHIHKRSMQNAIQFGKKQITIVGIKFDEDRVGR